jgi:hypothetical protein
VKKLIFILVLLSLCGCDRFKGDPGNPGVDGLTSLVKLERVTMDSSLCESEAGVLVSSGLDLNRNAHLENSEITQSQVVCDGASGQDGINGTSGSDGQDGTLVVPVQFCAASFVPSYPDTFPELGFCINNEMYGVYSTHGGFMVLLTPGQYNSNGVEASCTFTLNANCQVTN